MVVAARLAHRGDHGAEPDHEEGCRGRAGGGHQTGHRDHQRADGKEPADGAVAFEEAKIIVVCRKLYAKDLDPDGFMDERIAKNYPNGDYHRMYLAEVVSLLVRED